MKTNYNTIAVSSLSLIGLTMLSGVILSSNTVSAEDPSVVDQINITVPVSCAMSGTGMESHNAEILNGFILQILALLHCMLSVMIMKDSLSMQQGIQEMK